MHRRIRDTAIISRVYANGRYRYSFRNAKTRFNIHIHPSSSSIRGPGFTVVAIRRGRRLPRRRSTTTKEIEQGEIRARAFFARRTDATVPLNDRERRFLLRDLFPFSLSARHDFSFSLSPYLRLSLLLFLSPSLFLLLVPPARGTKARCVNSRKNGLVLLFH